jgi:hypothetical protein
VVAKSSCGVCFELQLLLLWACTGRLVAWEMSSDSLAGLDDSDALCL